MYALNAPRLSHRGGSLQLEADGDLLREQRNHLYLSSMHLLFTASLVPLMMLRLVKHRVQETYANAAHFDVLFCFFVWIAFTPTVFIPILITFWTSTRTTWRERLRDCFYPSNPKLPRAGGGADSLTDSVTGMRMGVVGAGGAGRSPRASLLPPPPRCPSPIAAIACPRGSRGSSTGLGLAMQPSPDVVPENGQILSV